MTTIREYAAEKGVSYEAVRRQVARYSAELEGHIEKQGKMQLLDDFAVAFLDDHRAGAALAVYKADATSELKRLGEENKQLNEENKQLNEELKAAYKANAVLSQTAASNAALLASAEQTRLALTAAEAEKEQLRADVATAKATSDRLTAEKAQAEEKALAAQNAAQEAQERAQNAEAALAAYKALPWYKRLRRG